MSIDRDSFFGDLLRWLRSLLGGKRSVGAQRPARIRPAHIALAVGALVAVAYAGSRWLRLARQQRRVKRLADRPPASSTGRNLEAADAAAPEEPGEQLEPVVEAAVAAAPDEPGEQQEPAVQAVVAAPPEVPADQDEPAVETVAAVPDAAAPPEVPADQDEPAVETAVAGGGAAAAPPVHDGPGVDEHGFVILNQATAAELQQLPGVGARRAQAIIRLRDRLGRIDSLRQLLQVRGISESLLEAFEPMIVLDAAPRPPRSPS